MIVAIRPHIINVSIRLSIILDLNYCDFQREDNFYLNAPSSDPTL